MSGHDALTHALLRFHSDMIGRGKVQTDTARRVSREDPALYAAHMAYRNLHQGPDAPKRLEQDRIIKAYFTAFRDMQARLAAQDAKRAG